MIFRQLFDYQTWTYTYLLADEKSGEAVLIDSVDTQVSRDILLLDELGLCLTTCLETHIHADHITGAGSLRERLGCKTAISQHAEVECADIKLADGDVIMMGDITIKVIETPGHTNTCLSFQTQDKVFTGDSLLIRGCGRTDFQSGDAGVLFDSINEKLLSLPGDVHVYPGHDYRGMSVSTIQEEKLFSPRLQLNRTQFIEHMKGLNLADPKKMDVAIPANLSCGRNQ